MGFREVTPAIRRVHREYLEQRQTELGLGESKVSCHSVKKTGWKLRVILGKSDNTVMDRLVLPQPYRGFQKGGMMVLEGGRVLARGTGSCT